MTLTGSSWQLLQLNGRSIPPQEGQYTLLLGDENSVAGAAVCNKIMGSYIYSTKDRTLKFDHMGMTRMMCHEQNYEDDYAKMFGEVTHYEVDGTTLILLGQGQSIALFRRI